MNPERLLQHFERLAEAPDAITRLRRLILNLAVRGKLVEQNPNDEPARELLKGMRAEKVQLVKAGKLKQERLLPAILDAEKPFPIPKGWELVRISECYYGIGNKKNQIQTTDYLLSGLFPVIDQGKLFIAAYSNDKDKLLTIDKPVIVFGDHTKNVKYIDFDFIIGADGVKILCPYDKIYPKFFYRLVQSYDLADRGYARHFKVLNEKIVPLPPLAEQHRIVAKVDELMALCDELEAAQTQREDRRDKLVRATLNRLSETKGNFADSARFYFNQLPRLTARPEHIKQLRQTILNFAVMGKLVPQILTEESGAKLLKNLEQQKLDMINSGMMRKPKPIPNCAADEISFELPLNWEWTRLGRLTREITSGSRGWAEFYSNEGAKFIRAQNIRFGYLELENIAYVKLPDGAEGTRTSVQKGDILLVITGAGVTHPGLLESNIGEAYVSQHVGLISPIDPNMSKWLLICLMATQACRGELLEKAYGSGKPGLNLDNIRMLNLPVPPLAEQHRIVAKVDELMALCDELEANLATTTETRRRLLEATLQEALGPVETISG